MRRLPLHKRILILRCLVEGMGIRATARAADVSKLTVARLLKAAGQTCAAYQDQALRNLSCSRIEVDEIWSFVYAKAKNVEQAKAAPRGAGDVWTWVAMCPETKLVPSWRIGDRTLDTATAFMKDLQSRLAHRVQLTSDGHKAYLEAVEEAFGCDVDYAMLQKIYSTDELELKAERIVGEPDLDLISTSMVERQNLTMRMSMRRFTRQTNAFSKKLENHAYAVALHFMHYNFCRIHMSLDVTPAMAAGVTPKLYDLDWIVSLVEADAPKPRRPKTYQPRKEKISISK